MIQHRQMPEQPIVLSSLSYTRKNHDLLLDMSGLLFKPMPTETSVSPNRTQSIVHEAHMRDTVIISIDTLPLASLPYLLPTSPAQAYKTPTSTQTYSSTQKHKTSLSLLGEAFCYTLVAAIVVVIYMVIPLMTAFIPLFSNNLSRLLIALEVLAVIEFVVFCILRRTIRR